MYIIKSDINNTLGGLCGRRQEQRRKATMICHGRKVGSSFYTQEMGGGDSTGEGGQNIGAEWLLASCVVFSSVPEQSARLSWYWKPNLCQYLSHVQRAHLIVIV